MSSSLESGSPPTRNVTGRVAKLSAARIHRACASSARSAVKRPPVAARSAASSAETRAEEAALRAARSEEDTSELQSLAYIVCRLLLSKKKIVPTSDMLAGCIRVQTIT